MDEEAKILTVWLKNIAATAEVLGSQLDSVAELPRTPGIESLFDALVAERARLLKMHEKIVNHLSQKIVKELQDRWWC